VRTIFGVLLLAVAAGSTSCANGGSSSAAAPSTPAGVEVTAHVAIVYANILSQSCEALSGNFRVLHRGAVVTLEDPSSHEVGRGRLGPAPPGPVSHKLCAWGTDIEARVQKGERYTVVVGDRFPKAVPASLLIAGKKRVVMVAK
jgi:hypothetical protein